MAEVMSGSASLVPSRPNFFSLTLRLFKVTKFSGLGIQWIWRVLILAIYNTVSRYNA